MNDQAELRINNIFHTIQGEGFNWGRRALFVRMPFCNLKCSWCDTEFNTFGKYGHLEFMELARSEATRFAVLTGGEPMANKQSPIVIEILKNMGFEIAVETNGMFPIMNGIDFATISPKRDGGYKIHQGNEWLQIPHEFKYVVDAGFDWSILARHKDSTARKSLSPEFGRFHESIQEIAAYIKENPAWRISLQTHKWMNVP